MPERIDRVGQHKTAFQKNKRIILATQDVCALCGAPVDKSLKAPDPMSPNVDHIIPISKGGHPSSLDNLQLTHRWCNLHKGDKLFTGGPVNNPPACKQPPQVLTGSQVEPTGNQTTATRNRPVQKSQAESLTGVMIEAPDNNNLPLHADWYSFTW